MKFPKYTKNLTKLGNSIISYTTEVANIEGNYLVVNGYWSQTTSKHINYVANYYGLTKINRSEFDLLKS